MLDVQQAVPGIFADAKYKECYRKGFDSFARFSMPIILDTDMGGKLASPSHVNLISNERELLAVAVPEAIKAKINAAQKKSPVGKLDLSFDIKVKNDTGKSVPFNALAVFVDGTPQVYKGGTADPGRSFLVTLSDVSAKAAVEYGRATVLIHGSQNSNKQ